MNLQETYDLIAEDWHKDHLVDTWWIEPTEHFLSMLPKDSLLLDVGCAGGLKAKFMIDRGMRVVGVDIAKNFIEIAKREVPAGDFRVMDMADVGSMSERFDGICAQASLLHIPKKQIPAIMSGFKKILKPGGYLAIAVKERRPDQAEEAIVKENDYGYDYERLFSYFSTDEMIQFFQEAGLTIVDQTITNVAKTNWIHVIGKKT